MKRNRIMSLIAALLVAGLMLCTMAACGGKQEENSVGDVSAADAKGYTDRVVNVAALSGPTGISMAKLAYDAKDSGSYNVTFAGSPDEMVGLVTTGEVDIACVPTNLAATLYNKTQGNIRVAAVTTLGVLYLLDASGEIDSIADLAGKTIGATGQGSNPEYILNYILENNGLTVGEDVNVEYYTEHSELAALMVSGEVKTAILPVPFATQVSAKVEGVKAIDLQAEWAKVSDTEVAQGVIICSADFADKFAGSLDDFLADFAASSDYALANAEQTAQYVQELGIIASAEIAQAAIPLCNIVYIDGEEMAAVVGDFLRVLYDANPKAVGGAMPADDFYYIG